MRKMKYNILLLSALIALSSLAGCTRRSLLDDSDKVPFKIVLDWGTYSKPSATGYFFYEMNGGAPLYLTGTTEGFEGYILPGTYRIVIFNTDPVNASLQNNGSYEDDHFVANELQSRKDGDFIECVSNVYGTGISEVTVPRASKVPVVESARPVDLVRRVTYLLSIDEIANIESLTLQQSGAIVDKRIVSNLPFTGNSASLLGNPHLNEEGLFEVQLSAFGFVGPCILTATVTFVDGTTAKTIPIDITEELIHQPEDDIIINLVLQLEDIGEIMATVKIHGWKAGGSGGAIIQ